jgi:hypothetical protein
MEYDLEIGDVRMLFLRLHTICSVSFGELTMPFQKMVQVLTVEEEVAVQHHIAVESRDNTPHLC